MERKERRGEVEIYRRRERKRGRGGEREMEGEEEGERACGGDVIQGPRK